MRLLLLTCVEQGFNGGNKDMSDAVKQEIYAIAEWNKLQEHAPDPRSAEVKAIEQVFCRFCLFFCIITSLLCIMIMPAVLESFTAT